MMKAIALLRVSTEAQAGPDRQGLKAQRRLCESIAAQHGLELVEWVELKGVSGASVLSDPRFAALLQRLEDPRIDGVVVAEFSRLMRPERLSDYEILEAFRVSGKALFTPEGRRDVREFGGRMLSVLQAELAAYERKQIADRTRRGREEKRRLGQRAEGPLGMPRGVAFDSQTGRWSYLFPVADRVREAFRLFLSTDGTLSFAEIGRRVGIQAGNGSWAVRSLLSQPLYAGIYRVDRRWRRVTGADGKTRVVATPRKPDEIHEHVVLDPALVSKEDFERVQELLALRLSRKTPRRNPDEQVAHYAGFLDCGKCGSTVWIQAESWKNRAAYLCGNARSGGCPTGHTSHRLADPQIDRQLEAALGSVEALTAIVEAATSEGDRQAVGSLQSHERRLTEIGNEKTRAGNAYIKGAIAEETLDKRLEALKAEEAAIGRLMRRLTADVPELGPDTLRKLAEVFSSWTTLSRDDKRELLRDFGIRLVVTRPQKGELRVQEIRLGAAHDRRLIFKKLKRFGLQ